MTPRPVSRVSSDDSRTSRGMQRAVRDVDRRGEVERAGELSRDAQRVGRGRRPVLADREVERVGGHVILDEKRGDAADAGGERRRQRRVRQLGGDEALEPGHELMPALGRQVECEQLDGHQPLARRIVRAKHRPQRPRTNLMKNSKRSERVRRRSASSFGVQ